MARRLTHTGDAELKHIIISMIDKNYCRHLQYYVRPEGWEAMTPEQRKQAFDDCLGDFYERFLNRHIKSVKVSEG